MTFLEIVSSIYNFGLVVGSPALSSKTRRKVTDAPWETGPVTCVAAKLGSEDFNATLDPKVTLPCLWQQLPLSPRWKISSRDSAVWPKTYLQ